MRPSPKQASQRICCDAFDREIINPAATRSTRWPQAAGKLLMLGFKEALSSAFVSGGFSSPLLMPFVDLPFRLQPVTQIMTRHATTLLPKFVNASDDLFFHAGTFIHMQIENVGLVDGFVFHNNIPVRRRNNRSPIQRSRRSGCARPRCRKEVGARRARNHACNS